MSKTHQAAGLAQLVLVGVAGSGSAEKPRTRPKKRKNQAASDQALSGSAVPKRGSGRGARGWELGRLAEQGASEGVVL